MTDGIGKDLDQSRSSILRTPDEALEEALDPLYRNPKSKKAL
jgi:hypothetical protein